MREKIFNPRISRLAIVALGTILLFSHDLIAGIHLLPFDRPSESLRKLLSRGRPVGRAGQVINFRTDHLPFSYVRGTTDGGVYAAPLRLSDGHINSIPIWVRKAREDAIRQLGSLNYVKHFSPLFAQKMLFLPEGESRLFVIQGFRKSNQSGVNFIARINRLTPDPKHPSTLLNYSQLLNGTYGFFSAGEIRRVTHNGERMLMVDNWSGSLQHSMLYDQDIFAGSLSYPHIMRDVADLTQGVFHHLSGDVRVLFNGAAPPGR